MSASSGGYVTDLTPERAYDVDIRRLEDDEKRTAYAGDIRNERQQNRVEKSVGITAAAPLLVPIPASSCTPIAHSVPSPPCSG